MKKSFLAYLVIICFIANLSAQKPPLDHSVYDTWKTLGSSNLSKDGAWVTYTVNPQQGDGWLYIHNVKTGIKDSVARGGRPAFSPDTKYLVYQVIPSYSETREAKKKKLKDEKAPKNNLEIKLLATNNTLNISRVKSFAVAEENSYWMAFLHDKKSADQEKGPKSDSLSATKKDNRQKKPLERKGTELVIFNPIINKEFRYPDVTEYVVATDGKTISFLQEIPDTSKTMDSRVSVFDTQKEAIKTVFEAKGTVKNLSTDKYGDLVSFIFSEDTSKVKVYDLWLSQSAKNAGKVVESSTNKMLKNWSVSENGNITFSDNGTRIYFGTSRKPVKEITDTLLEDEKFKLDIWSWDDDIIQPMQKKQLQSEIKRTYQAVYHIDKNVMYPLADTNMPTLRTYQKGNSASALGISDLKYRRSSSWDGGGTSDYYLIDINTGSKKLILEKNSSRAYMSPSCKYLVYFNNEQKSYFSIPVAGGLPKNITSAISVPLCDELNDVPDDPSTYGIAGWTEDEKYVLLYDRYDIWSVDLNAVEKPTNITNAYGRSNNITLRYNSLDPEADFINKKDLMYLTAFNSINKESGFYTLKPGKPADPAKLIMDKASFPSDLTKAKDTDILIWQKGSFSIYPDLYISNMNLGDVKKISVTNPQQDKYNWGTAELVDWMSFDREKLQGILYKPENFDPSKKYPMIVYFYERSSDGLYNYMPPAPSASIVNRVFAVSNDYLLFVPDIPYVTGYPGQSCYNSVVSGTYALIDRFNFIDKDKLALDGQSWGGYQIAWLVTQTDLFSCAYAGAVVSNMISAYGGIRWGTGMSRMFQYEHTQSRIGGTLWEKPVQFIENSPIFYVPKINTPLLLMHNDADGAVPWYQGIEFIMALRRLDKPAWLLSYNDEDHNLVRRPNRKDISIRKMQFFDHYLKGTPMPYWMKNGITQAEKGKIDGYDLVND